MYREALGLDTMAKTKTQLYRDIKVGTVIMCLEDRKDPSNTGKPLRVLNKGAEILTVETQEGKTVRIEIPRASSMRYVGAELVVYGVGMRPLNATERQVLENIEGRDYMTAKRHLENVGYSYLMSGVEQGGKSKVGGRVKDKNVTGGIVGIYNIPNAYSKV